MSALHSFSAFAGNIGNSCADTFSLASLVSATLGIGFPSKWTNNLPKHRFQLCPVRGIDLKIGRAASIMPGRWRGREGAGSLSKWATVTVALDREDWPIRKRGR